MEHEYRILPARRLACFRFRGRLTVDEGARLFLAYAHDPGFDSTYAMLCDTREVTEIEATFQSMLLRVIRLAPELARFREPVISAVLVESQTVFGYVRMLEQILDMTTQVRMRPAWGEAEALALVGQSAPFAALFA